MPNTAENRSEPLTESTDKLGALRRIFRSWFELTRDEQKVLLLILALFLLGLSVRFWHLNKEGDSPEPSRSAQIHSG